MKTLKDKKSYIEILALDEIDAVTGGISKNTLLTCGITGIVIGGSFVGIGIATDSGALKAIGGLILVPATWPLLYLLWKAGYTCLCKSPMEHAFDAVAETMATKQ